MKQVHHSSDGKVWMVLSHQDPGIQNWLDTEGREKAVITHRWMKADNDPELKVTLIQFSELARHLPEDLPSFNREQRLQQVSQRNRHVRSRFHN